VSRRENLRFNSKKFRQVHSHPAICRTRDGSIDREKRLLQLPGLAQAFRQRSSEEQYNELVLLSVQALQRAL
jgi:hypothetical protein